MKKFFIISYTFPILYILLFHLAFSASITCNPCHVGRCECIVSGCTQGYIDIYNNSQGCSGIPINYIKFSGTNPRVNWEPNTQGTYSLRIYCNTDDKVECFNVNVDGVVTTTTSSTTTIFQQTTTTVQGTCAGRCGRYEAGASCQCDIRCRQNNDCCGDICRTCPEMPWCSQQSTITTSTTTTVQSVNSCRGRCGTSDEKYSCQCDPYCKIFGDCCRDICDFCSNLPFCTGSTTTTLTSPTTTITSNIGFYCKNCILGECSCEIFGCTSGIFYIYNSSNCGGTSKFNIPFSSKELKWKPSETGKYYGKINCDNGQISGCSEININGTQQTTTTIPQIYITCEKPSSIFIGETNKCSILGCSKGFWFITNKKNKPLAYPVIEIIPPNTTSFGPAVEEGIISVKGICSDPETIAEIDINVEKGIYINCGDCKLGDICKCEIFNCTYGLLSLFNYNGTPLKEEIFRVITSSTYPLLFTPIDTGEVLLNIDCREPFKLIRERRITIRKSCSGSVLLNISPSIVATSSITRAYVSNLSYCENKTVYIRKDSCEGDIVCTTKGNGNCQFTVQKDSGNYTYFSCIDKNDDSDFNDEGEVSAYTINVIKSDERFKIKSIVCSKIRCDVEVDNDISSDVIIFITVVGEQREGKIYYTANLNIPPKSSGKKGVTISKIRECEPGTRLKVIGIAYKQGDLENQIDKYSSYSFTC